MKFMAKIDGSDLEIKSRNPEEVLKTLGLMGYSRVPTVERLLVHMFVENAAYVTGSFQIIVSYQE